MITRIAFRLRSPITSSPANYLTRLFSSSPPAAYNPNAGTQTAADETDVAGGSAVCRDARKYPRPSTVTWSERLHNSVSFTGNVEYPLRQFATDKAYGVFTILRVKTSPVSNSSFRIFLEMWDELAQKASQHLKPNDYIHVSGHLGAYTKAHLNGIERVRYKVVAKELNYIKQGKAQENCLNIVKSASEGLSSKEKYRNRLLMWQVLFANPSDWYDNRKTKKTPKYPDFTHKSTDEAL